MEYELIYLRASEENEEGWWTVIDTEICDGPFPDEAAAHKFMAAGR